jgi:hypothetical protein
MPQKVVIAASASNQEEVKKWVDYWVGGGFNVIDWPVPAGDNFFELYPEIHKKFFKNIVDCDILFVANYDKNDMVGYIGAETFAELAFAVTQNLINNKNIKVILAKMPSGKVQSFDEVNNWSKLGWLEFF